MHERTQRSLARLVFVLCCAVPTFITVFCIVASWTPWYHQWCLQSIETRLSTETGLLVQLDDFALLSPSSSRFDRVRLYDPETGREVARVAQVNWFREDQEIRMVLQQPELQTEMLGSSWKLIHDRFLCRPDRQTTTTRLIANDLTLHSLQDAITLRDVQAWIEPQSEPLTRPASTTTALDPTGLRVSDRSSSWRSHDSNLPKRLHSIQTTITCVPASHVGSPPIRASIRRSYDGPSPTTRWTLDTGEIPLPCSALMQSVGVISGPPHYSNSKFLGQLGSQATFMGSLTATTQQGQWTLENLSGDFDRISLDEVFKHQTHRLSGTANLHLDRCRIEPSKKLVDIDGAILADTGVIGRSLLYAASAYLDVEVNPPDGNEDVLYDRMAFQFRLHGPTLRLGGTCRHQPRYEWMPQGVVARSGDLPLAISSPQEIPAIRLMSLLAPAHSEPVPVSEQNQALLSWLAPSGRITEKPYPNNPGQAIRPRIRTADRYNGSGPITRQPYQQR